LRVIAGIAKGHRLKAPAGLSTRPMADKVKGSLFSVLLSRDVTLGRVLDLYAGSGSLGIEALSRGADWVDFVETNTGTCRIIGENLEHTKFDQQARVHCRTVAQYLAGARRAETISYDIILMDPPYADPHISRTIDQVVTSGLARAGTVVIVGHSPRVSLDERYGRFARTVHRRLGDSSYSVYEFEPGEPSQPEIANSKGSSL
jgi:16S rRNA (guanine966-N2)-methyltransferase